MDQIPAGIPKGCLRNSCPGCRGRNTDITIISDNYFFARSMIRNIIFDLGGVLLNLDVQRTLDAFRNLGMPDPESLFGVGHAAGVFKAYEKGTLDDDQFLEAVGRLTNGPVQRQQLVEAWNALLLDFPAERIRLLEKLGKRYRLFLFSNTNGLHLEAFREIFQSTYEGKTLEGYFERAYYSHLAGCRKPDAEAYRLVLEDNSLLAGQTLFVDDALVNVEGARAVGLQAFHVSAGRDVLDLGTIMEI